MTKQQESGAIKVAKKIIVNKWLTVNIKNSAMNEATVIIKCPKCFQKALFKSNWNNDSYVLHPAIKGTVVCSNCGYTGLKDFSKEDYYYQVPVGNKVLYARTLENLLAIRNFFQDKDKISEPGIDFPKIFYKKRDEIIRKINLIAEAETGNS